MNYGEPLENWLEEELIKAFDEGKIKGYKREEKKVRLKRKSRTVGKYDFEVSLNDGRTLAIECKSVSQDSVMTTPLAKGNQVIKTHQLKALREVGIGSLLLEYRNTGKKYWITIDEFYQVMADCLPRKSISQKKLIREVTIFDDILEVLE